MVADKSPIPFGEPQRLEALRGYEILDTPPEPTYDSLTRLAATLFDVPIALISLVDADRQWFKSHYGLEVEETPRNIAFCAHAILEDAVMQVTDSTQDPCFAESDLVTGEPGVRFYAGAPLISPEGFRLGTFCIVDQRPRDPLTAEQQCSLTDLARLAVTEMELHKFRKRASRVTAKAFQHILTPPERGLAREAQFGVLAALAHELRTPLNAVLGFGETMQQEMFGPLGNKKYRDYADCICRSGSHLLDLVNNILDFARLEHGDLRPNDSRFELAALVDDCLQTFVEESRRRGVALRPRLLSEGTQLKADRRLIGQILLNLIGNGLKYTDPGGSVTVVETRNADGCAVIEIVDTGIGMAPNQEPEALRPFGRLAHRGAERDEGAGLGLPLSKRLIELHGGTLVIRSRQGKGTTVGLHFPAYRVGPDDRLAQEV